MMYFSGPLYFFFLLLLFTTYLQVLYKPNVPLLIKSAFIKNVGTKKEIKLISKEINTKRYTK